MGTTELVKTVTHGAKKMSAKTAKPVPRTDDKLPLVDNIYLLGTVGNVVKRLHALSDSQRGGK